MVELPLCLSTILEMFGGTEVLTFMHYVLVSDCICCILRKEPQVHIG